MELGTADNIYLFDLSSGPLATQAIDLEVPVWESMETMVLRFLEIRTVITVVM